MPDPKPGGLRLPINPALALREMTQAEGGNPNTASLISAPETIPTTPIEQPAEPSAERAAKPSATTSHKNLTSNNVRNNEILHVSKEEHSAAVAAVNEEATSPLKNLSGRAPVELLGALQAYKGANYKEKVNIQKLYERAFKLLSYELKTGIKLVNFEDV